MNDETEKENDSQKIFAECLSCNNTDYETANVLRRAGWQIDAQNGVMLCPNCRYD